jgi:ATP-dependent Lhr-like helicase
MTLEVGIDIGNIDAVVLVGAPPSVSSLLQRIGRGSRRKPYTTVIGLAKSVEEKAIFRGLFDLAKKGELEDVVWHPCFSVAVQQILSISFQGRTQGIPSERMSGLLEPLGLNNDDAINLILRLREKEYLVIQRGLIYPSQKTLDLANRGLIHSNIGTDKGYQVVNSATGEKLGEIGYVDTHLDGFVLGGKLWKVLGIKGSDVLVKIGKEQAGTLSFVRRGRQGAFYNLLPSTLKEKSSC